VLVPFLESLPAHPPAGHDGCETDPFPHRGRPRTDVAGTTMGLTLASNSMTLAGYVKWLSMCIIRRWCADIIFRCKTTIGAWRSDNHVI